MVKLALAVCAVSLVAGCSVSLAPEVRARINPDIDYAALQADPGCCPGQTLLLGGAIESLAEDDQGSMMTVLRWELDRFGDPLVMAEAEERFQVRSAQPLDPRHYQRGRLVTLAGTTGGSGVIIVNGQEMTVPLVNLVDIHLWDTPFRYGRHRNVDPAAPEYVAPTKPGPDHPYDPTPWDYPYSPYTYRNRIE